MADGDRHVDDPFPDFDPIKINMSIEDPSIEGKLLNRILVTQEEIESSDVDVVAHQMRKGAEDILKEYQRRRDGGGNG